MRPGLRNPPVGVDSARTDVDQVDSLAMGPALVAGFEVDEPPSHPAELREIPSVRHSLPRRDPGRTVAASAALGTLFLPVVAATTGDLAVLPWLRDEPGLADVPS